MAYAMPGKVSSPTERPMSSPSHGGPSGKRSTDNGSWVKGLITLLIVLAIIVGGIYVIVSSTGLGGLSSRLGLRGDWQAVFLSNNQVYFGHIAKITDEVVVLKNIYYLQVVTQPLQRSQEGDSAAPSAQTEQRLTLIKLGNEIHGPDDEMVINRDHVVLMEDLKNDSQVVKAINDYVSQKK